MAEGEAGGGTETGTGGERLGVTPWQTVGPYFHYALPWEVVGSMAGPDVKGERIVLTGRVFDGEGQVLPDALVEVWQANAAGRYRHPDDAREAVPIDPEFIGFGRAPTGDNGVYRIETILPGRVPGPGNALQARHLAIGVFGRGILRRLVTRAYFAGDEGHDEDPVLALVPEERRATLMARDAGETRQDMPGFVPHVPVPEAGIETGVTGAGSGAGGEEHPSARLFVFDIHLQGPAETVFFEF